MLPFNFLLFLNFLLLISLSSATAASVRRLDDSTVNCAPCNQNPPSLPPPIYPSPPPPPKKKEHKSPNCPPPPPPSFMYITGPPGDLYPIDRNYNAAGRRSTTSVASAVVGLVLAGLLLV